VTVAWLLSIYIKAAPSKKQFVYKHLESLNFLKLRIQVPQPIFCRWKSKNTKSVSLIIFILMLRNVATDFPLFSMIYIRMRQTYSTWLPVQQLPFARGW
jgi:uncharacterized protein with PQ loop repeat